MAAFSSKKAEAFLLLLLSRCFISSLGEDPLALLDRQVAQLNKLETLVEALSRTVSKLESSLSECSTPRSDDSRLSSLLHPSIELGPPVSEAVGGGESGDRAGRVAVTKYKASWSERFQFAAAARLEAEATCGTVIPYEDYDGLTKYFAVGDTRGRAYVFSSSSDVLIELSAPFDSAVTVMLSYLSFRKNESLLFTGHSDGSIVAHRFFESNSEDWMSLSLDSSRTFVLGGRELNSPAVLGLEVHQVGRIRYILASDGSGRIRVFMEDGTLYGTAIASRRPLAFMKQRLLFLTETGAGSLDLRSMSVREIDCEGLNGSMAKSYLFDALERSKAYGFTEGGDLIHVVLLGDATNLKCRVRAMRRSEIDSPVSFQMIKGYLLVVNHEKVFVYNVSSQYYGRVGAPRPLFFVTLQEIKSLFLNSDASAVGLSVGKPLIVTDREKLVVLGLGGGYIGIYRSNFPVFKIESSAVVWSVPALLFLLFLIGIWQFYVKKKDSLGWTPEESFNGSAVALGSSLGSGPGDRAFVDSTWAGDPRELRGSALRGPPRRYTSPPRYTGGSGIPFRPNSADPGFRGPVDLNYRGQSIETAGFPKRKEPLFPNSQGVDDHID